MMIFKSFTVANAYNFGVQRMTEQPLPLILLQINIILSPGTDFVKNNTSPEPLSPYSKTRAPVGLNVNTQLI